MLETSHLRCFVAVAEELHFGRAAQRLNMTQPPLSRQIQLLEHTMRCELFHRNSRTVRLTHAGQAFMPDAQRILRMMDLAAASAGEVAAGRKGVMRCGFTASAAYDFLPRFVAQLRQEMPEVSLSLREMVSRAQLAAMQSGEVEFGVLRVLEDKTANEHRLVGSEALIMALPQGHPLTGRKRLFWRDLHRQPFVHYEPRLGQYFHNLTAARLEREGIAPDVVHSLEQIHSIVALVRAGAGLAVVPESARMMEMRGVEYRAFDDPEPVMSELFVVWHPENSNPLVPAIAEIATAIRSLAS